MRQFHYITRGFAYISNVMFSMKYNLNPRGRERETCDVTISTEKKEKKLHGPNVTDYVRSLVYETFSINYNLFISQVMFVKNNLNWE